MHEEVAEVILRVARYWLCVRGIYLAMEGDICRDPYFWQTTWTHEMLRHAADCINTKQWENTVDRWNSNIQKENP